MRALLIGNYGVGNLGDEALKEYFLQAFPQIEWTVVSQQPGKGEVCRLPLGLRSLFRPWWKTIEAYKRADAIVFGGGSLWTDSESFFACLLWSWHAWVGAFFGKPIYLAFQGIGPLKGRYAEKLARNVVRRATFVSVRDDASLQRIASWNMNKNIVQTFDPIFSLIKAKKQGDSSQNVFTIIPRQNSDETFREKAVEHLTSVGSAVEILRLQPDDKDEKNVTDFLADFCRRNGIAVTVRDVRTLAALMAALAPSSFVLAQRYHGALAAFALGKHLAIVPQREDDKLAALAALIKNGISAEALHAKVQEGEHALKEALHPPSRMPPA